MALNLVGKEIVERITRELTEALEKYPEIQQCTEPLETKTIIFPKSMGPVVAETLYALSEKIRTEHLRTIVATPKS